MSIGTTSIELREFKEKKKKKKKKKNNMDKIGKVCLALIWRGSGIIVKYFIHTFVLTCSMLKSHQKSK